MAISSFNKKNLLSCHDYGWNQEKEKGNLHTNLTQAYTSSIFSYTEISWNETDKICINPELCMPQYFYHMTISWESSFVTLNLYHTENLIICEIVNLRCL